MNRSPWEQALRSHLEEALAVRRSLHRKPELAFSEFETTALIQRELAAAGIPCLEGILPTGVVGVLGDGAGKTILLREDIDALPMQENTGLSFASERAGVCHSCGHDIHTAALLLTAKALADRQAELHGTVVFVFQPAEETAAGAKAMLAAALMEKLPPVDAVVGFHTAPNLRAGKIGLIRGPADASTDEVRITVKSAGGHGAHPYRCADPVVTAAYLLTQLQTVVSRENPAVCPAVLTFGQIHGGTAANIIPTEVTMSGTLRAFHEDCRHAMWQSIRRICQNGAEALRAEAEVEIKEGVPVLTNDPAVADAVAAAAERILGAGCVQWQEYPSPGSDDFSCFLAYAPGTQFRVGTADDDPNSTLGLHNPKNIYDETSVYNGAAVMLQYVVDSLQGE